MTRNVRFTTRGLKVGLAIAIAISLLGIVSVGWAQPQPPDGIDGINGVINHACPDAYEIDDQVADAVTLTPGSPQQRNFDGNTNTGIGDKDWARFQVVRTAVYTITTSALSAQTDTVLQLFDANNKLVAENDDAPGTTDFSSRIVWTAPATASGWYYVLATNGPKSAGAYTDCAGTAVSYTLSLQSKVPNFIFLPAVLKNY